MEGKRFYSAHIRVFNEGRTEVLLQNRNDDSLLRLPRGQFELFTLLSGCKPLQNHLEALMSARQSFSSVDVLSDFLMQWVRDGLLRPEELLWADSSTQGSTAEDKPLVTAVLTSDRSASLSRWLSSRLTHADFNMPENTILVLDDSRDRGEAHANRAIVEKSADEYVGCLRYFGSEERVSYAARLQELCGREGIDPGIINSALFAPEDARQYVSIRANRNLALLLAGGGSLLFSDDDHYYPPLRRLESKTDTLRFDPGAYPAITFHTSMSRVREHLVSAEDCNLLSWIRQYLGRPIALKEGDVVDLEDISPPSACSIEKGEAWTGVVSLGCYGARWFADRFFISSQRYFSDDEFYYDRDEFFEVLKEGLNILAVDQPTVRYSSMLQGGTYAVSGELQFPAYFAIDRHEDTNFNQMLFACNQETHTLHLPGALFHYPFNKGPLTRKSPADLLPGPGRMNQFMLSGMLKHFIAADPQGRLKEIGLKYRERARLSVPAFNKYLVQAYRDSIEGEVRFLQHTVQRYGHETPWWTEEVSERICALESSLEDPLRNIPPGFQRWIGLYGELLEAWPLIRRKAAEISPLNSV